MDSRDLRHASAVLACLALGLLAQTTEAGVFVQCPGDTDGDGGDEAHGVVARKEGATQEARDDADEDRADFEKFLSIQSIHRSPPYSCE